jgi:hypothetical protein
MALAYTKAGWNFEKYLYAYAQNLELMEQRWWWGFKDTLVRLGWEVRGGHAQGVRADNTVEANGAWSGTDPWVTPSQVTRIGYDFYIILRAPNSPFEICMGSNYATQTSYANYHFMRISHSAGFGLANGGANGTGTTNNIAPPTATDQQVVYADNTNTWRSGINNGGTFSIYGAISNDGLNTRLIIKLQRGIHLWFSHEHLDNPHANLDNSGQVFAYRVVESLEDTTSPMSNSFFTSALYYGRVAGINRTLYAGTSGYANLGHQSLNIVQQDNKMVVAPMDLYNNTLGEKGYYGTIPDMYYGNNSHFMQLLGDSVGGLPKWFSGGSIISPWDSVTPEPLPRVF